MLSWFEAYIRTFFSGNRTRRLNFANHALTMQVYVANIQSPVAVERWVRAEKPGESKVFDSYYATVWDAYGLAGKARRSGAKRKMDAPRRPLYEMLNKYEEAFAWTVLHTMSIGNTLPDQRGQPWDERMWCSDAFTGTYGDYKKSVGESRKEGEGENTREVDHECLHVREWKEKQAAEPHRKKSRRRQLDPKDFDSDPNSGEDA